MRTIDRVTARFLHTLVKNSIEKALEGEQVNIKVGTVTYDAASARMKVSITIPEAQNKVLKASGKHPIGTLFNLPTPMGKNRIYEIIEYNPRRYKYPYTAVRQGSKSKYKFSQGIIDNALMMHPF